jgi:hypothetical protein
LGPFGLLGEVWLSLDPTPVSITGWLRNSLKCTKWRWRMVKWLGRRRTVTEDGYEMLVSEYRGRIYVLAYRQAG